jgi:5-methylcytosine-specific restriction enzyme A
MFNIGQIYTKNDIYQILNVPLTKRKGAWDTGYRKYNNAIYVFCNIGTPGRTGHDYNNHWENGNLVWFARTKFSLNQPLIREMLDGSSNIYIFIRENDRKPFTYIGKGVAILSEATNPVKITWKINV